MMSGKTNPNLPESEQMFMQQYQAARRLKDEGDLPAAIAAFERCFAVAAALNLALLLPQYIDIMMMIGFCHAERQKWAQALTTYHALETVLQRDDNWQAALPRGLRVSVPSGYDTDFALATLGDSIALAYDNSGQWEKARPYYRDTINAYLSRDMKDRAAQTWYFLGVGAARRGDWTMLGTAGSKLVGLANTIQHVGYQLHALHFLVQAAANREQYDVALDYLRQAIAIETQTGHPDLLKDQQLLAQLERTMRTPPLLRQMLQTVVAFAAEACAARIVQTADGSYAGLIDGNRQPSWIASIDEMTEASAAGVSASSPGVELHLMQTPPALLRVFQRAGEDTLTVRIMVAFSLPNVSTPTMAVVHTETVAPTTDALARLLRDQIARRRLTVTRDKKLTTDLKPPKR